MCPPDDAEAAAAWRTDIAQTLRGVAAGCFPLKNLLSMFGWSPNGWCDEPVLDLFKLTDALVVFQVKHEAMFP